MNDAIVRLKFNYWQHYEPSRSRKGTVYAIDLSDTDHLSVRLVEPANAGRMINQRVTLRPLQIDLEGRTRKCPLEHPTYKFFK